MSERYSGESYTERFYRERDPLAVAKDTLEEIDGLLAKINEQGGELTGAQKQFIRNQIQGLLASLGLTDITQLVDFSRQLHQTINGRLKNPKIPSDYPIEESFVRNMEEVISERKPSYRPWVGQHITASEVARFGISDWNRVKGRGGKDTIEYQFELGKLLCDELAYIQVFDDSDRIRIGDEWQVQNGRHRSLSLRSLGESFAISVGLDGWVKVEREN